MAEGSRRQRLEELFRDDAAPAATNLPLLEDERVVVHQYAKTPETGGELALTDRRLIFTPWRFTALGDMFAAGFTPVPAHPDLSDAMQQLQLMCGTVMISLDTIESAAIGRKASLYRPPGMRVATESGTVEFGILVGPYKRNRSAANSRARDAFVSAVNALLRTNPQPAG